jgi:hypothetical protein
MSAPETKNETKNCKIQIDCYGGITVEQTTTLLDKALSIKKTSSLQKAIV